MKTLIELAQDAGVAIEIHKGKVGGPWEISYFITPELERFAKLVRDQERNRCAMLCEGQDMESFGVIPVRAMMITNACAESIRSGETK